MGYRGKVQEQQRARELRAQSWTLMAIAQHLGVAKSSVSVWVRDVEFEPGRRRRTGARRGGRNALRERKLDQIATFDAQGRARMAKLSDDAFLAAGLALYAGEGGKPDGSVRFTNTDDSLVRFFCIWLRRHFNIDETRLRGYLYLHQHLDLQAANDHWSTVTGIPLSQFRKPYRAAPQAGIRLTKHVHGCFTVVYSCSRTHREIMGLVRALFARPWSPETAGSCGQLDQCDDRPTEP